MGQKVNPHGLRVGVIKGWDTQWYADKKDFGRNLKEDYDIRKFIKDKYYAAAISRIAIERAAKNMPRLPIWCPAQAAASGTRLINRQAMTKQSRSTTSVPPLPAAAIRNPAAPVPASSMILLPA